MSVVKNNKKKVAYVVSLYPCWSETFILNEIIDLDKRGYDVSILSIRSDLEEHIHEEAKPFIKNTVYIQTFKMMLSVLGWMVKRPIVFFKLLRLTIFTRPKSWQVHLKNVWCVFCGCYFANEIIAKGIDHMHAHFATYPALVVMVIQQLTGVPYTVTTHAHDIFLEHALLKEKVQHAKKVVTISQYNRKYLTDLCGQDIDHKIEIIHCGLNMTHWQKEEHVFNTDNFKLLAVGRLTEMKGFEYLIRACGMLKNKFSFHCHIIGDGHLKDKFRNLISELELEDCVILEGVKDSLEVKAMMRASDIFVMPSVWNDEDGQDGIPLVLMEALALGLPSIATRISGLPELIVDQETGVLVKSGNTASLADAIEHLFNDIDLRKKVSHQGRIKVEQEFNIEKSVDQLIKVFDS